MGVALRFWITLSLPDVSEQRFEQQSRPLDLRRWFLSHLRGDRIYHGVECILDLQAHRAGGRRRRGE